MVWKHEGLTVAIWSLLSFAVAGAALALWGTLGRGEPRFRVYVWVIALPALILDVTMDLDLTGLGKVVATFVQWRAAMLGVAAVDAALVRHGRRRRREPWTSFFLDTVEAWLALSWVSTVLVGLPMLQAVVEAPHRARRMALGAAISSFVFQLPTQIVTLETAVGTDEDRSIRGVAKFALLCVVRLLKNPVAWAICAGCTISRTHGGDDAKEDAYWRWIGESARLLGQCATPLALGLTGTYLAVPAAAAAGGGGEAPTPPPPPPGPFQQTTKDPPPEEGKAEASSRTSYYDDLDNEETGLGDRGAEPEPLEIATPEKPVAAAATTRIPTLRSLVFLLVKITAAPGLMYCLAQRNLNRRDRRAAVLLACTPCSSASVVIAQKYGLDDNFAAHQALYGLLLLLPAVLAWSEIMDTNDLP